MKGIRRGSKFSFRRVHHHNVIESMRPGYRLSSARCEYLMNVAVNEARPY